MEQLKKLKGEPEEDLLVTVEPKKIHTSKVVKTSNGDYAEVKNEGFDFSVLRDMKPYLEGDTLPEPVIRVNKRGERFLRKPGEPRFYFNKNEMIKIYRGLSGKKRKLFWIYNEKNQLDRKIRLELRRQGIPGA